MSFIFKKVSFTEIQCISKKKLFFGFYIIATEITFSRPQGVLGSCLFIRVKDWEKMKDNLPDKIFLSLMNEICFSDFQNIDSKEHFVL